MVTGMGFSKTKSLLLVTPMGAYEVVALIGLTYLAMKTLIFPKLVAIEFGTFAARTQKA
jgi:hypothetical protein